MAHSKSSVFVEKNSAFGEKDSTEMSKDPYRVLAESLLPWEIAENFDLINVVVTGDSIESYLDERNILP